MSGMSNLKVLALLVAPGVAQVTAGNTMINDPDHIARLNAEEGSMWRAAQQEFFEGMTFEDARSLLGARLSHISKHLNETLPSGAYKFSEGDLPDDFDSRAQWQGLVHPIRNQQQCGSCWAFSASEVLSDRVAIVSGKASPVLSPEDLVSCDKTDHGCQGGYLDHVWKYLVGTGIVTDSCFPYTAGKGKAAKCATQCADSEDFARTKAQNSYAINGAVDMQKDMMQNGPVQVAFMVYKSFMSYRSGVYHKHKHEGQPEGGHAVKCVGWGVADGKPYWIMANSWDTIWGEKGFFRIRRGKDECGIESMGPPYAGLPAATAGETEIVV